MRNEGNRALSRKTAIVSVVRTSCWFFLITALLLGPHQALATDQAPERTEVSIDWSKVPDALLRRCRLQGLQNLLLQTVVEGGFAIVEETTEGIQIRLSHRAAVFVLRGAAGEHTSQRRVKIPAACDATIGVELQGALRSLLDELQAHLRVTDPPEPLAEPPPDPPPPPPPVVDTNDSTHLQVGAGVALPDVAFPMPQVQLQLLLPLGRWRPSVGIEVTGREAKDAQLFEGVVTAGLHLAMPKLGPTAIEVGATVGLLGHLLVGEGAHADVRFALPLSFHLPALHIFFYAMPTVRLVRTSYGTGGIVYAFGHLGAIMGAGWASGF